MADSLNKEELTPEELQQEIIEVGAELMDISAQSIKSNLRFMGYAVSLLELRQKLDWGHTATDGQYLIYDPKIIIRQFTLQKNQKYQIVSRTYLHSVLHCVMQHMYVSKTIDHMFWNLACDIAVENMISEIDSDMLRTGKPYLQEPYIIELSNAVQYMTAEHIYEFLVDVSQYDEVKDKDKIKKVPLFYKALTENREAEEDEEARKKKTALIDLTQAFRSDLHDIWYMDDAEKFEEYNIGEDPSQGSVEGEDKDNDSSQDSGEDGSDSSQGTGGSGMDDRFGSSSASAEARAKRASEWADVAERMQQEVAGFSKQAGIQSGSLVKNLKAVNREKYDYTSFLRQFSVMGEEMQVNEDEFDYIYYTLGLDIYENIPLIEPLEYKEVKKIKEFVIAVDTSGSTTDIVQTFLQKTYNIMMSTDSYFKKTHIRIIQCDSEIKEDALITSIEELDKYIKNLQIKGFGGTDFRPVFKKIDKYIEEGEFTNLKGLIYFTDGYGLFPDKAPKYRTAFVFLEDIDNNYDDVPKWAIKLILKKQDILSGDF